MKQLRRIYVTEKQFRHKQSQKGAKFMHKIHKLAIDTSRARHDALTYTMNDALQSCLRVEPIWIDSKNKFTPVFARYLFIYYKIVHEVHKYAST